MRFQEPQIADDIFLRDLREEVVPGAPAGLRFARSVDLKDLLVVVNETLGISVVNRTLLGVFNYGSENELESMDIDTLVNLRYEKFRKMGTFIEDGGK